LNAGFRDNFTSDGLVCNDVVAMDADSMVDVEGASTGMDGNLLQMGSVGGIPTAIHENNLQSQTGRVFNLFVNSVLSFISGKKGI
jgi:hypothetical protein